MNKNKPEQHHKIQDYQIIEDLGYGSFSKVQLVKRKADGKLFAMKNILLNKLNQKQKQSSLNEIRILASIKDPHIIKYEDSFYSIHQKSLCIVMQYAQGGDLQNLIIQRQQMGKKYGLTQKLIWSVAYNILSGLKLLHQNNIIHRDLKCANIFFSGDIAKLGDLNISKITQNGMCATQTGTPYYTSPQIWKGNIYDSKCDIWSLGCILYQMVTLKHPFNANDFSSLGQKIITGVYEPIPQFYSKELAGLIKICFTVNNKERPSAKQLLKIKKFQQIQNQFQNILSKKNKQNQRILFKLIQPIKLPQNQKQLQTNLTSLLPHPGKQSFKKKTVNIFDQQDNIKIIADANKFKIKKRLIKSQKNIGILTQQKKKDLKYQTLTKLTKNKNTQIIQKTQKTQNINLNKKIKVKFSSQDNQYQDQNQVKNKIFKHQTKQLLQSEYNLTRQESIKKLMPIPTNQKTTSNFKIRKNQPKSLKIIPLDKNQKQNKSSFNHLQKSILNKI